MIRSAPETFWSQQAMDPPLAASAKPNPSRWFFFDWARVNFHYLRAERSVSMILINFICMSLFAGLVAYKPIGRILGLELGPTVLLLLGNFIPHLGLTILSWRHPTQSRLSGYLTLAMVHSNLFIAGSFIALSGDPATPLWAFYVMYLGILAHAFGFQPYLLCLAVLTGFSVAGWFGLRGGNADESYTLYATGLFTFLGAWEYIYLGYQVGHTQLLQKRAEQLVSQQQLDEEKERISQEIHDGLGAQLTGAILCAHVANRMLKDQTEDPCRATLAIVNMQERLDTAMSEVRLALWSLEATGTSAQELQAYLQRYFGDFCQAAGIGFFLDFNGETLPLQFSPIVGHHIFRLIQEAVTNAIRHAAPREIRVGVEFEAGALDVSIVDNGVGIGDFSSGSGEALPRLGQGLKNMMQRARELGGRFQIEDLRTGGTAILVSIPLGEPIGSPRSV